jgi:hypothetical protein
MHLDDEQVRRLLDAETSPSDDRELRDHIGICAECRERLAAAERDDRELAALLGLLDHPAPRPDLQAVVASARRDRRSWGRLAAGLLLALTAAGVAYAAPGSPLPGWTRALAGWVERQVDASEPATAPSVPAASVGSAGVAIAPGATLEIAFTTVAPDARLSVALYDGTEVRVRAPSGAASFTSDADRLVVDGARPGTTFEIEIPRAARRVEISAAGTRVFLKEGGRVTAKGRGSNRDRYLIPLSPPGR